MTVGLAGIIKTVTGATTPADLPSKTMTNATTTPDDEKASNIEIDVAENAYGDLYEFYRCTSCGVEAGQQWQVEQACTCGDA